MHVGDVTLILVGVTLLLTLMLLTQLRLGRGQRLSDSQDDEDQALPSDLESRVERLIGLLNYGDEQTATEAMRHLMSIGPGILPVLFVHLSRLEQHPGVLAPRCQLMIEQMLVDFGLQTYLQCGDHIRAIHRSSPVFPSAHRVLTGIGPNLLIELTRGPMLDPMAVMAPLFYRFDDAIAYPMGELLDNRAEDIPSELLLAALPVLSRDDTKARDIVQRLYTPLNTLGRLKMIEVLGPWIPGPMQPLLEETLTTQTDNTDLYCQALMEKILHLHAQGHHEKLAETLCEALHDDQPKAIQEIALMATPTLPHTILLEKVIAASELFSDNDTAMLTPPAESEHGTLKKRVEQVLELASNLADSEPQKWIVGLLGLGTMRSDPRATERLLQMAEDPRDPYGSFALLMLASDPPEALEDILARRVRSAQLTRFERFHLRLATIQAPNTLFEPILLRLLRADSARVVSTAALMLAPSHPPTENILKALGRHRSSPLEGLIAPLVWSRWPTCRSKVLAALTSDDREIREAAVDLLAGLGSPHDVPELLAELGPNSESIEARLNAVEMLGPDGADKLSECIDRDPEFAKSFALVRRLKLLRLLPTHNGTEQPRDNAEES